MQGLYGICTIKCFNPLLLQQSIFWSLYTRTPFSCLWQKVEHVNGAACKWGCRSVNCGKPSTGQLRPMNRMLCSFEHIRVPATELQIRTILYTSRLTLYTPDLKQLVKADMKYMKTPEEKFRCWQTEVGAFKHHWVLLPVFLLFTDKSQRHYLIPSENKDT